MPGGWVSGSCYVDGGTGCCNIDCHLRMVARESLCVVRGRAPPSLKHPPGPASHPLHLPPLRSAVILHGSGNPAPPPGVWA